MSDIKNIVVGFTNLALGKEIEGERLRLKICNACPFKENNRCGVCGCLISAKVKSPNSTCPKGKW